MLRYIFLIAILCMSIVSCSSDDDNNYDTLILGEWKLISKMENYDGTSIVTATACQLIHFKMDFMQNNILYFTQVSDDPLIPPSECNPEIFYYTYEFVGNDKLGLYFGGEQTNYNSAIVNIEVLTATSFVFVLFEPNNIDNMVWTLTKM